MSILLILGIVLLALGIVVLINPAATAVVVAIALIMCGIALAAMSLPAQWGSWNRFRGPGPGARSH